GTRSRRRSARQDLWREFRSGLPIIATTGDTVDTEEGSWTSRIFVLRVPRVPRGGEFLSVVESFLLRMRRALQMLPEQIPPEISLEIPPHRMNVVGIVLRVVVLDEKRGSLDPVVMLLAALGLARPREPDFLEAGFLEACCPIRGDV